jgi:hypothetical protein
MSQNYRRDTFGAAIIGQVGTPTRIGRGPYVGTTYRTTCQSWRCEEHQESDVVNPAQHPGLAERHLTFSLHQGMYF